MDLREVLNQHAVTSFPRESLEEAVRGHGKSLRFEEAEIDALLESRAQDSSTFALMSLMYPYAQENCAMHLDHVFPRARFTDAQLRKASVPQENWQPWQALADQVPNLQLLNGPANQEKQAEMPAAWSVRVWPDAHTRSHILASHDLGEIPQAITEFGSYFAQRKTRMAARLRSVLGLAPAAVSDGANS